MRTSDRFHAKYVVDGAGCWVWQATIARNGYGQFWDGERTQMAHRYAYELLVGPIPDGLDVDHQCHNADESCLGGPSCPHRRCVNPAHLAPADRSTNLRRGRTGKLPSNHSHQTGKTHCPQGHPYDEANTYRIVRSDGHRERHCRTCKRETVRRIRERKRVAA